MENAEPFVGINPDDTEEVAIDGARIVVGVIDQGMWGGLDNEDTLQNRASLRRMTKWLVDNGEDPNADALDRAGKPIVTVNGTQVNKASMAITNDPEYIEKMHRLMVRAAKYAVRGHSGLVGRDGSPVPCEVVDEKLPFGTVKALSESTLRYYAANRTILMGIWLALRRIQLMGPREKKVSPPPSLPTSGGSVAPTAPESPSSSS